jgi:hypothetical protein
MRLSTAPKLLAAGLVVYVILDILLTPAGQLETRPVAQVTGLGIVTLALLFIGLIAGIVALVLLFRASPRSPLLAIIAAGLYFPAALADQTGHFSSLRPPNAIAAIELVQAVVAILVIAFGISVLRSGSTRSSTP